MHRSRRSGVFDMVDFLRRDGKALSWPNLVLLGFARGARTGSGITSR